LSSIRSSRTLLPQRQIFGIFVFMNLTSFVVSSVADFLGEGLQVLRDPVCGGKSCLQLFRDESRTRASRYAQPDALIVTVAFVIGVVECEEAGEYVGPEKLSEKFFKTTMCRYHLPSDPRVTAMPCAQMLFIQIVDSSNWSANSSKRRQFTNLELDINQHRPPCGSIRSYELLAGTPEEFAKGALRERLRGIAATLKPTPNGGYA
jgi:hypothetical protein